MDRLHGRMTAGVMGWLMVMVVAVGGYRAQAAGEDDGDAGEGESIVYVANLVYGDNKTSVCFSEQFLAEVNGETNIRVHESLEGVRLDSSELFDYPFVVMTGEGAFKLADEQVANLKDYLGSGGFLLVSAGCSSKAWNASFEGVMGEVYPGSELVRLEKDHPIYHSVYDITRSRYKSGGPRLPTLDALEVDGRVVMVWSPDGLNDTGSAGPGCCCCGGNEVRSARKLNVNILAYALTH
jgi:Domain of unknown function (DUF4159)